MKLKLPLEFIKGTSKGKCKAKSIQIKNSDHKKLNILCTSGSSENKNISNLKVVIGKK